MVSGSREFTGKGFPDEGIPVQIHHQGRHRTAEVPLRVRRALRVGLLAAALCMGCGSDPGADGICGNNAVEAGEVCDEGAANGGYGRCRGDCKGKGPHCGDGKVDKAHEACDDGAANGSYGRCRGDCKGKGPYCGDARVDKPNEACDDGVNDGSYGRCLKGCKGKGPHCGDGTCDPSKEATTCAKDCPAPPADTWKPSSSETTFWYVTEYANSAMSARTTAGQAVALVAGRHGQNFPYFHPKAMWDSVLLVVDDKAWNATASKLSGFHISLPKSGSRIRLYLSATMSGPGGKKVPVLFDLHLDGSYHKKEYLGVDLSFLPGSPKAGMSWQPVFLSLAASPASTIHIDGAKPIKLSSLAGELELATLNHLKDSGLAFRYDYVALASADKGYAYVNFVAHALYPKTVVGGLLEAAVSPVMKREITIKGASAYSGNSYGIPAGVLTAGGKILANHKVDLGLADLDRQLVKVNDKDGAPAWGLREVFSAK